MAVVFPVSTSKESAVNGFLLDLCFILFYIREITKYTPHFGYYPRPFEGQLRSTEYLEFGQLIWVKYYYLRCFFFFLFCFFKYLRTYYSTPFPIKYDCTPVLCHIHSDTIKAQSKDTSHPSRGLAFSLPERQNKKTLQISAAPIFNLLFPADTSS